MNCKREVLIMANECCCGGAVKLIYACSGASDVGNLADSTARKMAGNNCGKMTCLAAVGAHLSGFVESAKGAAENITIDGCGIACAKKILEHIGVNPKSYILTEMGYKKGATQVTDKTIEDIVKKISSDKGTNSGKNNGNKNQCC